MLDGGMVMEAYTYTVGRSEYLADVGNNQNSIIRFSNKKDEKQYEYSLTPEEIAAASTLAVINDVYENCMTIRDDYGDEWKENIEKVTEDDISDILKDYQGTWRSTDGKEFCIVITDDEIYSSNH